MLPKLRCAAVTALLITLAPRPAAACSPCPDAFRDTNVTNSERVPTNTVVRVSYRFVGLSLSPDDVQLWDARGAAVPGSWSGQDGELGFTPASPLAPSSKYGLADRFEGTCFEHRSPCKRGAFAAWRSFGTDSGPDTSAPVLSGLGRVQCEHLVCENSACCGPFDAFALGFQPVASEPLSSLLMTAEGRAFPRVSFETVSTSFLLGGAGRGQSCFSLGGSSLDGFAGGTLTLTIQGRDLAGNVSAEIRSLRVTVTPCGCRAEEIPLGAPELPSFPAESCPDASIGRPLDGRRPDAGDGGVAAGCGCGPTGASATLLGMALPLLLLGRRGRTRR